MLVARAARLRYDKLIESALSRIEELLEGRYGVSRRTIGLLLLQGDPEIERQVRKQETSHYGLIQEIVAQARAGYNQPLSYIIALRRKGEVERILSKTATSGEKRSAGFAERLSRTMMNPITGIPIVLVVLYFGLYQFVGVFGAGTLVDFIEGTVFGEWINPGSATSPPALSPSKSSGTSSLANTGL